MNRCYRCILGLHAQAIYSDVISYCTERVLFGNTVDHFRRSWIYYSFSTTLNDRGLRIFRPISRLQVLEDVEAHARDYPQRQLKSILTNVRA